MTTASPLHAFEPKTTSSSSAQAKKWRSSISETLQMSSGRMKISFEISRSKGFLAIKRLTSSWSVLMAIPSESLLEAQNKKYVDASGMVSVLVSSLETTLKMMNRLKTLIDEGSSASGSLELVNNLYAMEERFAFMEQFCTKIRCLVAC